MPVRERVRPDDVDTTRRRAIGPGRNMSACPSPIVSSQSGANPMPVRFRLSAAVSGVAAELHVRRPPSSRPSGTGARSGSRAAASRPGSHRRGTPGSSPLPSAVLSVMSFARSAGMFAVRRIASVLSSYRTITMSGWNPKPVMLRLSAPFPVYEPVASHRVDGVAVGVNVKRRRECVRRRRRWRRCVRRRWRRRVAWPCSSPSAWPSAWAATAGRRARGSSTAPRSGSPRRSSPPGIRR